MLSNVPLKFFYQILSIRMRSGIVVEQEDFLGKLTWQAFFDCFSKAFYDSTVRSCIYRSAFVDKFCMTTLSLLKNRVTITFPDEATTLGYFCP